MYRLCFVFLQNYAVNPTIIGKKEEEGKMYMTGVADVRIGKPLMLRWSFHFTSEILCKKCVLPLTVFHFSLNRYLPKIWYCLSKSNVDALPRPFPTHWTDISHIVYVVCCIHTNIVLAKIRQKSQVACSRVWPFPILYCQIIHFVRLAHLGPIYVRCSFQTLTDLGI